MTAVLEEWLPERRKAFAQNPAYRPTPSSPLDVTVMPPAWPLAWGWRQLFDARFRSVPRCRSDRATRASGQT